MKDNSSLTSTETTVAPSAADVLLALADRCEREESSRELDEAIARALNWRVMQERGAPRYWIHPDTPLHAGILDPGYHLAFPPRFTTSLDAAVTLVPEETFWTMGKGKESDDEPMFGAIIETTGPSYAREEIGTGESRHGLAPALCAAALRARAARL